MATDSDCFLLWEWANDPLTRQQSFNTQFIEWEDHVQWFSSKLQDPNCFHFIGLNKDNQPVGQVRFEIKSEAEVSISLGLLYRGQGYGSRLLSLASAECIRITGVTRINALIRQENIVSQRTFSKAGYSLVGEMIIQGNTVISMELLACNDSH